MNSAIVNKIFNPNVRFKTIDKNKNENNETCNNTIKTHHQMNFHSETTIPLSNNQNIFNSGQFSNRNSNFFRKKTQKTIIKEGPSKWIRINWIKSLKEVVFINFI